MESPSNWGKHIKKILGNIAPVTDFNMLSLLYFRFPQLRRFFWFAFNLSAGFGELHQEGNVSGEDVLDFCKQQRQEENGDRSPENKSQQDLITSCLSRSLQTFYSLCLRTCSSRSCRWPRLWTSPCRSRTPAARTILRGGWLKAVLHLNNWCLLQCICCWVTTRQAGPAGHTECGGWTSCGHRISSQLWCFDQSLWTAGSCYVPGKQSSKMSASDKNTNRSFFLTALKSS